MSSPMGRSNSRFPDLEWPNAVLLSLRQTSTNSFICTADFFADWGKGLMCEQSNARRFVFILDEPVRTPLDRNT
ncbi:hypothetical protein CVT25_000967 [Psilocybe cyanescens]|uniref:Uncharacterized protein n=1 Tax=Psilocybe cyanescens TaxID=93625 RepID=A0A409VTM4_PSICY|nr:hypothetical protein CVT25_000967 [Psilocybe cyanescens]